MSVNEQKQHYDLALSTYRSLFGSMDESARAIWFFISDESEVLSFTVGRDETPDQASVRHGIKLAAMANALAEQLSADQPSSMVDDLLRLAAEHGYRHGDLRD
jgi:hypothetical protein